MSFSAKPLTAAEESNLLGIEPDDTVSNQENIPLSYFAGPGRFPMRWIGDVYSRYSKEPPTKSSGKGGKGGGGSSKSGWINFGSVVGFFAAGPIDELNYIVLDNRILWEGSIKRSTSPSYAQVVVSDYGTFRLYWGTSSQTTTDTLVLSTSGDNHPPYRNIPYMVVKGLRFGVGKDAPGNLEIGVQRTPQNVPAGIYNTNSFEGANPFAVIAEILFDDVVGIGQSTDLIDAAQWDPVSDSARHSEAFAISGDPSHVADFGHVAPKITKQTAVRSVIADILSYPDGFLRLSGTKIEAGIETHDGEVAEGLPEVTHHDFVGVPRIRKADTPQIAELQATYRDRTRHLKVATHKDDSLADTDLDDQYEATRLDLTGFATEHQAIRYTSEYLFSANQYLREVSGTVFRDALQGRIEGDEITLNYLPASIDTVFRIIRLDETGDPDLVDVVFEQKKGVFQLAYVPPEELRPTIELTAPDEVTNFKILQPEKIYTGGVPAVWIIAEKPTANAIGMHIHYGPDDSTYDEIGDQNSFALRGALAENITVTDTTFDITASGEDIEKLTEQSAAAQANNSLLLIVNSEVKSIGAVVANGGGSYTVTCLPGRLGSVAAAHSDGDEIWIIEGERLDTITHEDFPYDEENRYFKLQPYSYSGGPRDLGDITGISFTFRDIIVADPTSFLIRGVVGGFLILFAVSEQDVVGCRIWFARTDGDFTTEPTQIYSLTPREVASGQVRVFYTDEDFREDESLLGLFKIQLYDDKGNLSNVIGPLTALTYAINDKGPLVELRASDQRKRAALDYNASNSATFFTLVATTQNYTSPVTWSWYRYPVGNPAGTPELIVGESSNRLVVPTLHVDPSRSGASARKYRAVANGFQFDELTLHVVGDSLTPYLYLTNETITVNVDATGLPLDQQQKIGSSVVGWRQNVSMAAVLAANSASSNEQNYWLVLPTGLILTYEYGYPNTFRIQDVTDLADDFDDLVYDIEVWSRVASVDTKIDELEFRVRKNVVTTTELSLSVTTTGPTYYQQPLGIDQYFAVIGRLSNGENVSGITIVFGKVDARGVISFDRLTDDYPAHIPRQLVNSAGLGDVTYTVKSRYWAGDDLVYWQTEGGPTPQAIDVVAPNSVRVGFGHRDYQWLDIAAEVGDGVILETTLTNFTGRARSFVTYRKAAVDVSTFTGRSRSFVTKAKVTVDLSTFTGRDTD